MVITDTVINTLFGGLTLDPAGMHCPSRGDAFVSSISSVSCQTTDESDSARGQAERGGRDREGS